MGTSLKLANNVFELLLTRYQTSHSVNTTLQISDLMGVCSIRSGRANTHKHVCNTRFLAMVHADGTCRAPA